MVNTELRDAAHLMGKLTGEVDDIIHKEVDPKAEILQHGIGAENGVLFSTLCSMSNRHNGRTGMGLVMASKNLESRCGARQKEECRSPTPKR